MKRKTLWVILLVFCLTSFSFAYTKNRKKSHSLFSEETLTLTGQVVVIHDTIAMGGNLEYFISNNVSLGGDVLFFFEGDGGMTISPDVAYHFDVKVENLDVMVGAGPSLTFGFGGGSDFRVKVFVGTRYYFSSSTAGMFKLIFDLGSGSGVGAAFGITFKLK